MRLPTKKLSLDIRKNESTFRFAATSFMPHFPRTAPSIGEWSSSMVLIAFLGSGLGCQGYKALRHNQMPMLVGEGKIRQRAGTTPPSAAARCQRAGRSRPLPAQRRAKAEHPQDQIGIPNRSDADPNRFTEAESEERVMSKFKIE